MSSKTNGSVQMLRSHRRGRDSSWRIAGMEPTAEKKWACLQRREWNSGPFGAIERLSGGSFADRVAAGPGWKVCLFFSYASKSLMRMFGAKGNPQASNLFAVIQYLQEQEGIHLEVKARKVA